MVALRPLLTVQKSLQFVYGTKNNQNQIFLKGLTV